MSAAESSSKLSRSSGAAMHLLHRHHIVVDQNAAQGTVLALVPGGLVLSDPQGADQALRIPGGQAANP